MTPVGFITPDHSAAVDVDAHRALVKESDTVKGMFLQKVIRACALKGKTLNRGPYIGFKDYSGLEFIDTLMAGAELLDSVYPRRGLLALGRLAYPTLLESMIGKVVFGVLGNEVHKVLPLATRGYSIGASSGKAILVEQRDGFARLRLEDIYSFIDSYHVGVITGLLDTCHIKGSQASVKHISPTSAELHFIWPTES